jgi:hypothetical protein
MPSLKTIITWLFVALICCIVAVTQTAVFAEWWRQFHLFQPSSWTGDLVNIFLSWLKQFRLFHPSTWFGDDENTREFVLLLFVLVICIGGAFLHEEILKNHDWYNAVRQWYQTYQDAFWPYFFGVVLTAFASFLVYVLYLVDEVSGNPGLTLIYVIYGIAAVSFFKGFRKQRQISSNARNKIDVERESMGAAQNTTESEAAKYEKIAKETGVLAAVKAYKEDHNCSLGEAKNAIDSLLAPKPSD